MLLLYTSPVCPYCRQVESFLDDMQVAYESRDIAKDVAYRNEVLEKGGKLQIPFFVDTEKGVSMYESQDIIEYVRQRQTYANEK